MESTTFDELKEEIRDCKTIEQIKRLDFVVKNLAMLIKRRTKKILSENPPKVKSKEITKTSINNIARFLNEVVFTGTEREIKTTVLYDRYKKWNKGNENRKTYSKNKLYAILNLGKRVQLRHKIDGDYFIFELNDQIDNT